MSSHADGDALEIVITLRDRAATAAPTPENERRPQLTGGVVVNAIGRPIS
jgi:hypothetical protein